MSELDLAQASLLAGLPQAPGRLSPLRHPEAAKQRQQYVLDQRAYAPDVATLNTTVPVSVTSYYTITINAPAGAAPPTTKPKIS